jgi:hypothetical protein
VLLLAGAERGLKIAVLAPLGRLPGQHITAPVDAARTVAPNIAGLVDEDYLAAQYLGRTDSLFARYVMRRVPDSPE